MNILVVGNVIKDIYLNLDSRTEAFEKDRRNTNWLNLSFDASNHRYFNRSSNYGGAAVTYECLSKLGLETTINSSDLNLNQDGFTTDQAIRDYRYILLADGATCYFTPTNPVYTHFDIPVASYDYLYIDRSAFLSQDSINRILAYLQVSPNTKLVIYVKDIEDPSLNLLLPRASLIFTESPPANANSRHSTLPPDKLIYLSDHFIRYNHITEPIHIARKDILTHLSIYSVISATILGCFVLGKSVEHSLRLARLNIEHSKLNSALTLDELEKLNLSTPKENLALIARSLVLYPKGILAADESGGNIHKKFANLGIPDTYDTRRDYRNLFFTTPHLSEYINGVILFDETARQTADNDQNFVEYLTSKRIIPGIKVDEGLMPLHSGSLEQFTCGLDNLATRLSEYYQMGLRFAKWRAAFNIHLNHKDEILTPTPEAISINCNNLAKYAKLCQQAHIVPIVEPEVIYDGYYDIDTSTKVTSNILDSLFNALEKADVNLDACILKTGMVLAGKQYHTSSTPDEIGIQTAKVLHEHVPDQLAGVVFLSGGQTPAEATTNLASVIKHGPFPWPVTFSFARALQEPALNAWSGNNDNIEKAHQAFLDRLIANTKALEK